jgi:hypothetical protein
MHETSKKHSVVKAGEREVKLVEREKSQDPASIEENERDVDVQKIARQAWFQMGFAKT